MGKIWTSIAEHCDHPVIDRRWPLAVEDVAELNSSRRVNKNNQIS